MEQRATADAITPSDVREALMWTGHLEAVFRGELKAVVHKATQAWQKSKGHAPSETLPDDQIVELVSQALKERDDVGWSVLRDTAVGFAIGVPTKLLTFGTPHTGRRPVVFRQWRHQPRGRRASRISELQEHGRHL